MQGLTAVLDRVRGKRLKVVLPEGDDIRILAGARRLVTENLAAPVVIGERETIRALAASEGIALDGIELVSPDDPARLPAYGRAIAARREKMTEAMSLKLAAKPVYFAAAMLAAGDADAMVAGVSMPTRRVIEAGQITVGLAPGVTTPSSFFLMVMPPSASEPGATPGTTPGTTYVFADCALNIEPGPAELADIAVASAMSRAAILGDTPLVAFLSFSTKGSGAHARVDKIRAALELARAKAPGIAFDGELQADAALVAAVAAKKGASGPVAGHANVLIFPDLDSGNIAYKLVQRLGHAQAIGPFLQGFAKPISDLSRGATTDDVVMAAAVALCQTTSTS